MIPSENPGINGKMAKERGKRTREDEERKMREQRKMMRKTKDNQGR